jgi:hypothetical protein
MQHLGVLRTRTHRVQTDLYRLETALLYVPVITEWEEHRRRQERREKMQRDLSLADNT